MNNQDVRVLRTDKLIRDAFLTLLTEKGFEAMTVQDILDLTQINRSTFYKHFANKNAVAKVLVEELKALVTERLKQRFSVPTKEFVHSVQPLFEQHHQLIYLIGQIETPKIHLYNDIHKMVKEKYVEHLQAEAAQIAETDLDFQAHLFATMTLGIMKYIIEKGEMPQVETLIQNVNSVFDMFMVQEV
ncbi:TetR/AcrR family transcriptional regulator [Aggregatibacter actinomycetemcomitans]|uniref:TetR/AcrR family transcriptional regulator n=1 Tax=Aggregatibacter actinomycetemcomitans TaxID=714 RepID=UPI00197C3854|nr:TetR/AcrR family transcriptional regulator [Aggregatibacter actinomycetemcomitans]MBN6082351.1 TetR/AcrR family transcriptional regulator [Aggregatibacter actinomycetemcomitans]